jgi:purine catabolism regulator
MVTVEQLCARLGNELQPVSAASLGRQQLTGVHISELTDPTPYLDGGELLLTTGIPLQGGSAAVNDYVNRLADKGIAALALGLGAGTDRVEPKLLSACNAASLDLFLVPEAVPFLHVSRAFWELVGRSEHADLTSRLNLQTVLARAATRENPVEAVITALARGLGGWAAYLPATGGLATIWPTSAADVLPQLRAESARFDLVGTYAAATFPLNEAEVVEHPITVGRRVVGFLAVSAGRSLRQGDRQLILTACMLLSLSAQRAEDAWRSDAARGEIVAQLVLAGHVDAARLVSEQPGGRPLPGFGRLLAIRARDVAPIDAREGAAVVASLGLPESTLGGAVGGIRFVIVPDIAGESVSTVNAGIPEYAIALGQSLPLGELARALGPVTYACRGAAFGSVIDVGSSLDVRGEAWVDALARHPRGDLRDTVRCYLAHRGQWERAARELGIHRNSLRHRIRTRLRSSGWR